MIHALPLKRLPLVVLLTAVTHVACSAPVTPSDDGVTADDGSDVPEVIENDPTVVDENFRIIYGYTSSTGTRPGEVLVGNPAATGSEGAPGWTADYWIVDRVLGGIGLDCSLGCIPNRDLTLMAVATGIDSATQGLDMQVVAFDGLMNPVVMLDQPITGIRQARLSGTTLFVSRIQPDCEAAAGNPKTCFRFESYSFPAGQEPSEPATLFVFPSRELLADSMYSGRFRVGADGSTLIIQNLEKGSVTFWLHADGALRKVGKPICQTVDPVDGGCAYDSDAPDLTDDMPVALTADGNTLVVAYVEDNRELRLAAIDTATGESRYTTLLRTPDNYRLNACYNTKPDWAYTRFQPPVLVSPDGTEVILTAASECDPNLGKSWTNIVAIPVAAIGTVNGIGAGLFRKITDFPAKPVPGCVSIVPDAMDISESGSYVAFAGTPMLDSNGRAILDDSPQHYTDREIFVTAIDGRHSPIQVSGNANYRASSVICSTDDPAFAGVTDPVIADP